MKSCKKKFAGVRKKGSLWDQHQHKLTRVERVVLSLLKDEYLTPKKIAIRRGTTVRAVQKTLKSLREKGIINKAYKIVRNDVGTSEQSMNHQIRLHGQQFRIIILYQSEYYKKILERCNMIERENNRIKLSSKLIEVYSRNSFFADDARSATIKSFEYWNEFFTKIENEFKIIIVKPRSQNIKQVKAHFSEINNELSLEAKREEAKINIHTSDDGKIWFTIDNSFNLKEAETIHPNTSQDDMQEVVAPFFNDLRDNKPPKLTDIMKLIGETVEQNKQTSAGLNALVTLMKKGKEPKQFKESIKQRPYYFQ